MKKIDTKTFKAINKVLMDRSTHNTMNNSHNTTNNNINNYIVGIGRENVLETITMNEKIEIMNSRMGSLEKMVEVVHCGTYDKFKNILITNLKDKFAYRYDHKKGYFVTSNKDEVLGELVESRMMEIEDIYEELSNIINEQSKKVMKRFLDNMNDEENIFMYDKVEYANFKTYKTEKVKALLYNNNEKITQDIASMLQGVGEPNL